MVVRIRWNAPTLGPSQRNVRFALLVGALMTPSALVAFTMAFWIIASDLRWTSDFFLTTGLFSHWQVWLCTAGVLLLCARLLDHYARGSAETGTDLSGAPRI